MPALGNEGSRRARGDPRGPGTCRDGLHLRQGLAQLLHAWSAASPLHTCPFASTLPRLNRQASLAIRLPLDSAGPVHNISTRARRRQARHAGGCARRQRACVALHLRAFHRAWVASSIAAAADASGRTPSDRGYAAAALLLCWGCASEGDGARRPRDQHTRRGRAECVCRPSISHKVAWRKAEPRSLDSLQHAGGVSHPPCGLLL